MSTSGNNWVIAGTDNNGLLHIRIFGGGGNPLTDTDETKRPTTSQRDLDAQEATTGLVAPTC